MGDTVANHRRVFLLSLALSPLLGVAYFPRTDPGQFVINVKAPTGTRIELTNDIHCARRRRRSRHRAATAILRMIVSNIGVYRRSIRHLHHELRPCTRLSCKSAGEGAQDQQLRLYGSRATTNSRRICREVSTYLPDRRSGHLDRQSRHARSDRHPDDRNNQQAAHDIASEMAAKLAAKQDV